MRIILIAALFIVLAAFGSSASTATVTLSAPATDTLPELPLPATTASSGAAEAVTEPAAVPATEVTEASTAAPTLDLSGTPYSQIAALAAAQLVPPGGREILDLPTAYAITSDPGYSFLALGHGLIVQDMVISFEIIWYSAGTSSACGLNFHANDSGQSTLLLTNDGQVVLTQRQDKITLFNYHQPSALFSPKTINTVTLVAVGDTLRLYLNGTLQTVAVGKAARGGFAFELYNARDNRIVTECRFRHIWVWTFDPANAAPTTPTPALTPNATPPATEGIPTS